MPKYHSKQATETGYEYRWSVLTATILHCLTEWSSNRACLLWVLQGSVTMPRPSAQHLGTAYSTKCSQVLRLPRASHSSSSLHQETALSSCCWLTSETKSSQVSFPPPQIYSTVFLATTSLTHLLSPSPFTSGCHLIVCNGLRLPSLPACHPHPFSKQLPGPPFEKANH